MDENIAKSASEAPAARTAAGAGAANSETASAAAAATPENPANACTNHEIMSRKSVFALAGVLVATLVAGGIAYAAQGESKIDMGNAGGAPAQMASASGSRSGHGPDGAGAPDGGKASGSASAPDGQGGAPGGGGANTQTFDYTGSYTATLVADGQEATASAQNIEATESLSNVALAENGGTLTIDGSSLLKSGDADDGDSCNFYGVNSVLLAVGEDSSATISDSSITASSKGSNGIFATDGATVYASNTSITTSADNSRGLDATYGGSIVATNMDISTQGDHCASFATDRGGGYITVSDSQAKTAGSGSPLIYSTGSIEVSNLTGEASGSQIAGMEGLNTISISNSNLASTITSKTASDPIANGVIIYQSTSGDADTATGEVARFEAVDSTLSSAIQSGAMFYCTNTQADIVLQNTVLDFDSDAANLIVAAGNDSNSWGKAGQNGATVSFTGYGETLKGNVAADTISSLSLYLHDGSTWTGAAAIEENTDGDASDAPITVNIDSSSTWVVSDSCTVSNLNAEDGAQIVDANGNTVSIVVNGETVVSGTSDIVVNVTGSYSTAIE